MFKSIESKNAAKAAFFHHQRNLKRIRLQILS